MSPEKAPPINEECFPDDKYTTFDTPSLKKDCIKLTKMIKEEGLPMNETLVTALPQEFKEEVCYIFLVK